MAEKTELFQPDDDRSRALRSAFVKVDRVAPFAAISFTEDELGAVGAALDVFVHFLGPSYAETEVTTPEEYDLQIACRTLRKIRSAIKLSAGVPITFSPDAARVTKRALSFFSD